VALAALHASNLRTHVLTVDCWQATHAAAAEARHHVGTLGEAAERNNHVR